MQQPRYPIYIPSKGRAKRCMTANHFMQHGVNFRLVVEPQEADLYAAKYGEERVLILPFRDRGSVVPARNWIMEHSIAEGHERHWQVDDNIYDTYRIYKATRIRVAPDIAYRVVEDFTDRYENIAISGMNYVMFAPDNINVPPFLLNVHVYSCTLINNVIPNRWRGKYNEDTDMCLQALAAGWCTVQVNAFLVQKKTTMKIKGGNTAVLYQGDGRLKMARSLKRQWNGVVEVGRRFKRPQHIVKSAWKYFDTPLKLKPGIDLSTMKTNEYGMKLKVVGKELKSEQLRDLVDDHRRNYEGKDGT